MPAIYSCTVHSISVLFVYESACISIFLFIYRGNHSGVPMCFVMPFFYCFFVEIYTRTSDIVVFFGYSFILLRIGNFIFPVEYNQFICCFCTV